MRTPRRRPALPAVLVLVLAALPAACTVLPWYRVPDEAFARDTVRVACCVPGGVTVEATYLGVGGWIFRAGDAAVLTAPLYSNPGLVQAGLTPISVRPGRIDRHLPDVSDVSAILVGHGHYDHLMDVPWIMEHRTPGALLLANRTSLLQVEPAGFSERALERSGDTVRPAGPALAAAAGPGEAPATRGAGRVVVLADSLAGDDVREGTWIDVSPSVRVMALRSDHAAHLAGVTLYSGERRTPMAALPESAEEWLDGETYAFLIDLMGPSGERLARIYYQDAVAAPPFGLVPPVAGDSVDIAVIVPATYAEVAWHPEAIVEDAEPEHVLLGHWENFFQAPRREAEPVPFTLLSDFRDRLERALPAGVGYHIPVPGTVFLFSSGEGS